MVNMFKGFIHLYINLSKHTIAYGDPSRMMPVGEAMIRFIYNDTSLLANRVKYFPADFESIHPYFEYCDREWRDSFIDHLNNEKDNSKDSSEKKDSSIHYPSIDDITELCSRYKEMIQNLCCMPGPLDLSTIKQKNEVSPWLFAQRSFSGCSLTWDNEYNTIVTDYFVSSFEECLFIEFLEIARGNIRFKMCKNCGKFFIPKRSNMDYCSRVYTQDGKTCAEVGYSQTFARNVKNDKLLQAYTRAYKAHYARMTKPRKKTPNMTREAFESWQNEARLKLDEARAGRLDPAEYEQWLKK